MEILVHNRAMTCTDHVSYKALHNLLRGNLLLVHCYGEPELGRMWGSSTFEIIAMRMSGLGQSLVLVCPAMP